MKNKLKKIIVASLTAALLLLMLTGTVLADSGEVLPDLLQPYSFIVQSNAGPQMSVQFVDNQMYHDSRYLGYGVSGKPMLSLRYLAEWFGFQVDYQAESCTALVSKGEYAFRIGTARKVAEIYWAGEKIKEHELTVQPLIKNSRLYSYSLDISELLGLTTNWDNTARIWHVLYRDYTYQELSFPTAVNDDELTIKGLLLTHGQYELPVLEIKDTLQNVFSYVGSVHNVDLGTDANAGWKYKYELNSTIKMQEENPRFQVSLTIGQRIIFAGNIDVVVNIEDKELVVKEPSYQFTSPLKGYLKVDKPEIIINGSVAHINGYVPSEVVLFAKKVDNTAITLKENIPIIDGQFSYKLALGPEEGLYKVTVNSVMAGPRGPAYPEITNFYVEFRR